MVVSCFRFVRVFVVICFVLASLVPVDAIKLQLTNADIDRALVIARGRDGERAQFHAPYIEQLNTPTVQSIEIVSEFRRVVLLAEDHILRGDRGFAYSTRMAGDAVQPWKGRVSLVTRLRFHPLNTYVSVPNIEITVDGLNADAALIGVLKEPQYSMTSAPGEQAALVGAVAEGVFDAALIGQTERTVIVRLDGKQLITARLDFRAIE
jgi:hypothetical protein